MISRIQQPGALGDTAVRTRMRRSAFRLMSIPALLALTAVSLWINGQLSEARQERHQQHRTQQSQINSLTEQKAWFGAEHPGILAIQTLPDPRFITPVLHALESHRALYTAVEALEVTPQGLTLTLDLEGDSLEPLINALQQTDVLTDVELLETRQLNSKNVRAILLARMEG